MEENPPIWDMFCVQSKTKHCKYQSFIRRTQKPVQLAAFCSLLAFDTKKNMVNTSVVFIEVPQCCNKEHGFGTPNTIPRKNKVWQIFDPGAGGRRAARTGFEKDLGTLHVWNALIQTQPRSPECNKSRMQLYQELSPTNKKNKQQNLGVRIFDHLCALVSIAQALGMSMMIPLSLRTGLLDKVQALHRALMLLGQCLKR